MAELSFICPTPGGTTTSGISLDTHETIDSLVHQLSEDTYQEIVRDSSGKVIEVNVLTSMGGTLIRKTSISRNAQGQVFQVTENQYDGTGSLVQTLVTDITRDGGQVTVVETDETELF